MRKGDAALIIIKVQELMLQFQGSFFAQKVDATNKRQLGFAQLHRH